jgi:hypothetical protein
MENGTYMNTQNNNQYSQNSQSHLQQSNTQSDNVSNHQIIKSENAENIPKILNASQNKLNMSSRDINKNNAHLHLRKKEEDKIYKVTQKMENLKMNYHTSTTGNMMTMTNNSY